MSGMRGFTLLADVASPSSGGIGVAVVLVIVVVVLLILAAIVAVVLLRRRPPSAPNVPPRVDDHGSS